MGRRKGEEEEGRGKSSSTSLGEGEGRWKAQAGEEFVNVGERERARGGASLFSVAGEADSTYPPQTQNAVFLQLLQKTTLPTT